MSEIGVSGTLFEAIFRVFLSFCKELHELRPSATEQQQYRCRDELERLFLWGDGVSTHDGYLDEVLLSSSDLRSSVLLTLLELGHAVCNDLFISIASNEHFRAKFDKERENALQLMTRVRATLQESGYTTHSEELDFDDSESVKPDLEHVLNNISTINDCLMDLSIALERPIIDSDEKHLEARGPAETFNVAQPALVYCLKLRDRFPRLPVYLVERLGSANLQRANMLRHIKDLTQTDDGSHFFDESLFSESIPQMTDTTKSSVSKDSIFSRGQNQRQPEMDFETSSQATFASYSTSASMVERGRPRVPPMPQQAEGGGTFRCEYCGKTIKGLLTRHQWKSHVFENIRPYVCTIHACELSEALFSSSRSWARHQDQHPEQGSDALKCPFCGASISSSTGAFYRHVGRHLREVSLAVLPQSIPNEGKEDLDSDESAESSPTPPEPLTKPGEFEPTNVLNHRYQSPKVLIAYLKTLPDRFTDDQIRVKVMKDGRLGLSLPRRLENEEIEGALQAFLDAERKRQRDDSE